MISYNSQLLQEICFHTPVALKHLGGELTHVLQARHADILAANNVYELPVGEAVVVGNICRLDFQKNTLSIVMRPNYGSSILTGQIDWATVERVKIMRINNVE